MAGVPFCSACGHEHGTSPPAPVVNRRAALQGAINRYTGKGWRVVSETDDTAQLIKPKRFSIMWFLLWLLLAVLPGVLYLVYHFGVKRDTQMYLRVDERGQVHEQK